MADFDLSLLATMDGASVVSENDRIAASIDKVANAETKAAGATKKSAQAADATARAEREKAEALKNVLGYIDPTYAAQQRLNKVVADAEKLYKQGAISAADYAKVQKLSAEATKRGAQSAGQARAAYTQLGFQIQDITQSLALGVNPMVVFGQQAGQTAAAVAGMGGALGKVGSFLAGPWGSIILGAVTVLGFLLTSQRKNEDAAKDLKGALDFQRMSVEELTKAIREQRQEAEDAVRLSYEQAEAARTVARENLKRALSEREVLAAELERAKLARETVNRQRFADGSGGSAAGGLTRGLADYGVSLAEQRIAGNDTRVAELERILRLREIPIARREAEAATDAAAAATLRYEKAEAALNQRFADGDETADSYQRKLIGLTRARDRDIERAREQERAQKKANDEAAKAASYADFALPFAASTITSGYGNRRPPTKGASSFHQGVDFGVASGTPVGAPQVGVVEAVGFSSSLGKYVVVDHGGGTKTRYGHLSSIDVAKGDALAQGQSLGRVGSTGRSTGPHLHYEVFVNGKRVDPTKGRFPIDDVKVAEAAENARKSLEDFGNRSSEAIARVTERFDEQPRLIDSAAQAARQLDSIIADLEKRKPIGWEKMVADAQAAKQVIADALVRPFDDLIEASERRMTIDRLIAANREDEAAALQQIWQLEARIGPLTNERKEAILDQIIAERELSEELAKREVFLSAYLDATRSIRGEIEAILSGTGKLSNLGTALKQLRGKILFERMFGDAFRDLEKFIKKENAVETSVDIMTTQTERAGRSAGSLADELDGASRRIANVGTPGAVGGQGAFEQAFGDDFLEQLKVGQDAQAKSDDIVVSAIKSGVNNLEPERYFDELGKTIVGPLLDGFDELFGTQFFSRLQGVFSGALSGYLTAGPAGGIIGALQGIKGLPEGISSALGKAMGGAQTGTMVAGLGNMLGIGMSSTGAQIGGAIGSMLPIPGGQIIGSIAGGLIGKLFGKTKYGTASVSSVDDLSVTSRGKGRSEGATSLGNSVQDGLRNIADALGADIGRFNVSIGTYKDSFRVSTTGRTGKLKAKYSDVTDFGDDEAAALAFALADAIGDGAIQGVSDAVQKALRSDSDIEKAVQEALKVKDLEDAIKYLGDDIGKAFDDFAKVAKDRLDLARKYGVDLVKVEELNAIERQKLIDDAIERQVGSLKSLLDDLNFGALFEGSPVERRDRLLREIADAQQDVDAGVDGAIDRLADLQRQLVETSRAAFGTAGTEYAADREQAATAAQAIIEAETARIEAAAAKADESLTLQSETNDLLADANGRLDTLINLVGRGALLNFGTVIENGGIGEIRIPAISY